MADIVSDEQLATVMSVYTRILSPIIQSLAVLSNLLTVSVFYRIGLRESVNLTFLALSLSDLGYVLLDAVNTVCLLVAMSPWQKEIPVSMYSLNGCIHWYQYVFLDTSTCLETYLAVTRCCCVALPLRFKNIFTLPRTVGIIAFVFAYNVVFRIPLFSSIGLAWQVSPLTNSTKLTFYSNQQFPLFNWVELFVARTICPVLFLLISITCSAILFKSLVNASVKRKSMTLAFNHTASLKPFERTVQSKSLSAKEIQLVKAVAMVIFLLGNVLLMLSVFSLSQAAEPELFPGKKYNRLHGVVTVVLNLVITSHCGYKVLIYYKYNSRFRAVLLALVQFGH